MLSPNGAVFSLGAINDLNATVLEAEEMHPFVPIGGNRLLLWVISFFLKRAIARHLREMRTDKVIWGPKRV